MVESIIQKVLAHIERSQERYIAYLKELVSQPSIASQGIGIKECAEKVSNLLKGVGFDTKSFPTGGSPIVFGESLPNESKDTILFYNHYDVVSAEPLDKWHSKPFEPIIKDGKLIGRGSADNKASFISRIAAIESILAVAGKCPVAIKFMVEGEEEVGSPNLRRFVEDHKELLKADAAVWEGSDRHASGRPSLTLGAKGMLYLEMRSRALKNDVHSYRAGIVPNPAWRLVWALNTLKGPDNKISIKGFYDSIVEPSDAVISQVRGIPIDIQKERGLVGLNHLEGDEDPEKVKERLWLSPAMSINGIKTGYQGEGMKTVIPAEAAAKVDIRLVPNQDPDDILAKITSHLRANGLSDIEITPLAKSYPARTDPESRIVKVAYNAAKRVYGVDPIIYPNHMGSGPMYMPMRILKQPVVSIGAAYYGSAMHGPDENVRIDDFILAAKMVATILLTYGQFKG